MTDKTELREEKAATPHNELIAQLLDSRLPKTEREHAAALEIEALRAEVERWKRVNAEQAKLHVKAEIRAERLAEALEEIRSCSTMNLAMQPDPSALTARLGDIHQIAGAALSNGGKA